MSHLITYPLSYQRRKTRTVTIGKVQIGSQYPIRVQSMIACDPTNPQACFDAIQALSQAGCELVRLAIPSAQALEKLPVIRSFLKNAGITIPLIADIHFSPQLAIDACEFFEKIRINPGNYSDTPKNTNHFKKDLSFQEGRLKLAELIQPLIKKMKQYQCALRIGVNQGSLSQRMLDKYGDTPMGMAQSALEMIELFEQENFDQIIVSLKSSNPLIVQTAYRLLANFLPEKESVPFHLGVTEAGNGEMGRMKSIAGMAPLLIDGIGDTIRVSLAENSCNEIIFAKQFLQTFAALNQKQQIPRPSSKNSLKRSVNDYRIKNFGIKHISETSIGNATSVKIGVPYQAELPTISIPFTPDFTYQLPVNDCHLFKSISIYDIRQYYANLDFHDQSKPCGVLLNDFFIDQQDTLMNHHILNLSAVLSEGLLDFILLPNQMSQNALKSFIYLLQATRTKISMTEYIICPGCGRTLFNLEKVASKIKQKTQHLCGLKIGIMGCIVNGPGEMADADFGYVGSGHGKVNLFRGQNCVEFNIPEDQAVEKLIALIERIK